MGEGKFSGEIFLAKVLFINVEVSDGMIGVTRRRQRVGSQRQVSTVRRQNPWTDRVLI